MTTKSLPEKRLERYTLKYPEEVLMVAATISGETDQIMIFRGFSSSLMRPTAFDPDVLVLPADAEIEAIDRLQGPYNPAQPTYLEKGISWDVMDARLRELGI